MNAHLKGKSVNADEMAKVLESLYDIMKEELTQAQNEQVFWYNKSRKPFVMKVDSKIWLRMTNLKTQRPSKKLNYKKIDPFRITEPVGQLSYRLDLPASMQIHPVFHMSLLEPLRENTLPGQVEEPPPPIGTITDEGVDTREREVEEILDSRKRRGHLQYLVSWVGCGPQDNQWVASEDAEGAEDAIKDFHRFNPSKPGST